MTERSPASGSRHDRVNPGPQPALGKKQNPAQGGKSWLLLAWLAAFLGLASAGQIRADTITGTATDPSGALVAGARVEITGGTLTEPVLVITDSEGKFVVQDLAAGKYAVRVSKEGFEDRVAALDLNGTAKLAVNLTIASQQTSVSVTGKVSAFANADPVYRQLRDISVGRTHQLEHAVLPMDVGTFEFKSGTITLLNVVNRYETGAIFVGQGHFTLKPVVHIDKEELKRRSGGEVLQEDFREAVFRFSGSVYPQISSLLGAQAATPQEALEALQRSKNKLRHRHEVPEGFTQAILEESTIDNVDADILAAIYNPAHPPFFNAYITGERHKDLRFFIRTVVGAIPQMDSPEEVALVNSNGGGMDDGIWYSEHSLAELKA